MTRLLSVLAAVACLATAPAVARAQTPAQQAPAHVAQSSGPRLGPEFKSFRPKLAQEEASAAAAAAADKTTITISTLGLVLLIVLLIILIA